MPHHWNKDTTVIVRDSVVSGIEENRIWVKGK